MSIITTDPAVNAANQLRNIVRQQFTQLGQSGVQGYNLIWRNRMATPQQVISALGTDAQAIFECAGVNIQALASAAEACGATTPTIPEIPQQYQVSFNIDGSATLSSTFSSSSTE